MIDTHCHLDHCDPPDGELVERAREAGLTRLATVGTNPDSIGRALAAATQHEDVFAIVGRHPHNTEGFGRPDLDEIWQRIKRLNRYVQDEQPWQLAKDESQAERLDQVLYTLAEGLRVVAVLLHAFMPGSAERLLGALGQEDLSLERARLGAVGGGARLGELGQLFPRVETPEPSAA